MPISCKNMVCYLRKIATKIAKIYAKIGKFYVKNPPKICTNFTPKTGPKRRCFCHFAGKKWCKIARISIDFLLKIYPKMAAVEVDFFPLVGHFFATKNKVICGRFVGKIHLQLECFLCQKLCDICNFLPRIFPCKVSANACKQLFWA